MVFNENIKKEVRRLSHFSCCLCKNVGIEIHHIVPQEEGGLDTSDNAAPLCPTCHELYGGNPNKRKMIREARDQWYEICKKRYSAGDRLGEVASKIDALEKEVATLKEDIPNRIIDKLKKEESVISTNTDFKKLSISKTIENILRFKNDIDKPNEISIEMTYFLLYKTDGDPNSEVDKEYNQTREEFLNKFGELVAYNICVKLAKYYKINWEGAVSETQLSQSYSQNLFWMIVLLHHEDLDSDWKVEIAFTENEIIARLTEDSIRKIHPWNYQQLTEQLKLRYIDFQEHKAFRKILRKLQKESRFAKLLNIDPKNQKSAKQYFYSPSIVEEFDKHFTINEAFTSTIHKEDKNIQLSFVDKINTEHGAKLL